MKTNNPLNIKIDDRLLQIVNNATVFLIVRIHKNLLEKR